MPDDARIITLEERIAYLERYVEQLDGVIRDNAQAIEQLGHRIASTHEHVSKRLTDIETKQTDPGDADASDDMPPHWGRKT